MYENNSRFSINFKGCSLLQLSFNSAGMCKAIGYYSYTNHYSPSRVKKMLKKVSKIERPKLFHKPASERQELNTH